MQATHPREQTRIARRVTHELLRAVVVAIAAAVAAHAFVLALDIPRTSGDALRRLMLGWAVVSAAVALAVLGWLAARLRQATTELRRATLRAELARTPAGATREHPATIDLQQAALDGVQERVLLLSRLSHQLRTPLQAVLGWCDLIALHAKDPEAVAAGVDVIRRNARLQSHIIASLMDDRREPQPQIAAMPELGVGGTLNGLVVLVVEDQDDSREFLLHAIREAGGDVMVASTAGQGLSAIAHRKPDVIVSDIGLPGVDGLAFVQSVREGGFPDVPALALTGYTREEDERDALAAGFTAQMGKPVNVLELVQSLRALDPRSRVPDPRR